MLCGLIRLGLLSVIFRTHSKSLHDTFDTEPKKKPAGVYTGPYERSLMVLFFAKITAKSRYFRKGSQIDLWTVFAADNSKCC